MWVRIFSHSVNGTIKNVYTWKDLILLLYMMSEKRKSIGRRAIMKNRKENLKNKELLSKDELVVYSNDGCFELKNIDLSPIINLSKQDLSSLGHFYYRKKMIELLRYINF